MAPVPDPAVLAIEQGPMLTAWKAGLTVGRYTLMGKLAIGGNAYFYMLLNHYSRQFNMSAFKILASVMLIYVNSFAVIANPSAIKHPIPQQIQTYLNSIDFEKYIEKNTKFNISFLVTTQNEIVVISPDNVQVDEAIKEALN